MSQTAASYYFPDEPVIDYEPEYFSPPAVGWMERCAENSTRGISCMPIVKRRTEPQSERPVLTLVPMPPTEADETELAALMLLDSLEYVDEQCQTIMRTATRDEIAAIARTPGMLGIWRTLRRFMRHASPPRKLPQTTLRLFE